MAMSRVMGSGGGGGGNVGMAGKAGASQVSYGPGEGCVDESGLETKGTHQGQ